VRRTQPACGVGAILVVRGEFNKTWGSLGAAICRLRDLKALLYRNLVRCRA